MDDYYFPAYAIDNGYYADATVIGDARDPFYCGAHAQASAINARNSAQRDLDDDEDD